jgi:hypothetical protein
MTCSKEFDFPKFKFVSQLITFSRVNARFTFRFVFFDVLVSLLLCYLEAAEVDQRSMLDAKS